MSNKLYSWSARRAGAGITISHSCGKIVNVDEITVNSGGEVIARKLTTGEEFHLVAAAHVL